MTNEIAIVTLVLVVGLAAVTAFLFVRASRARRELSQRLHDTALTLDRRCDLLEDRVQAVADRQVTYNLLDLLAQAESEGIFEPEVMRRLRDYAWGLHVESLEGEAPIEPAERS